MTLLNSSGIALWLPNANAALGEGTVNGTVSTASLSGSVLTLTLTDNRSVQVQDETPQGLSTINFQLTNAAWTASAEQDRRNGKKK